LLDHGQYTTVPKLFGIVPAIVHPVEKLLLGAVQQVVIGIRSVDAINLFVKTPGYGNGFDTTDLHRTNLSLGVEY